MIKSNGELWEILGDVEKFNSFLMNFRESIVRQAMLAVPALVIHHIKNEHSYNEIKNKFFDDNPELIKYKSIVANHLNVIASNHSNWSIEKVFTNAGIKAKKTIKQMMEDNNG